MLKYCIYNFIVTIKSNQLPTHSESFPICRYQMLTAFDSLPLVDVSVSHSCSVSVGEMNFNMEGDDLRGQCCVVFGEVIKLKCLPEIHSFIQQMSIENQYMFIFKRQIK